MPVTNDYLQWVLEQLSGAGRISTRRMFGAVGLYRDGVFFAILSGDVLYFKVDEATRADYERRGAAQFRPYRDKPHLSMSYYEVPADILEDAEECVLWVQRAVAAALVKTPPRRRAAGAAPQRKAAAKTRPRPAAKGRKKAARTAIPAAPLRRKSKSGTAAAAASRRKTASKPARRGKRR